MAAAYSSSPISRSVALSGGDGLIESLVLETNIRYGAIVIVQVVACDGSRPGTLLQAIEIHDATLIQTSPSVGTPRRSDPPTVLDRAPRDPDA